MIEREKFVYDSLEELEKNEVKCDKVFTCHYSRNVEYIDYTGATFVIMVCQYRNKTFRDLFCPKEF